MNPVDGAVLPGTVADEGAVVEGLSGSHPP
jgi:hypothetical protein